MIEKLKQWHHPSTLTCLAGYFKLDWLACQGRAIAQFYANGTGGEHVRAEIRATWLVSCSAARFSPVSPSLSNHLGEEN